MKILNESSAQLRSLWIVGVASNQLFPATKSMRERESSSAQLCDFYETSRRLNGVLLPQRKIIFSPTESRAGRERERERSGNLTRNVIVEANERRRNTRGYFRTDAPDAAYKNISLDRNVPFAPISWRHSIAVRCFVALHRSASRARVRARVIDSLMECVAPICPSRKKKKRKKSVARADRES